MTNKYLFLSIFAVELKIIQLDPTCVHHASLQHCMTWTNGEKAEKIDEQFY